MEEWIKQATMPTFSAKHIGGHDNGSIIIYGAGVTVSIDRTAAAAKWAKRYGMKPSYKTTDDKGETFTVWTGIHGALDMAIAIPATTKTDAA